MKESLTLNIVSFDVPFPANYGGVIDIFYKIKALHRQGVKVILHCFQYGRPQSKELFEYCEEVYYYDRKTYTNLFSTSKPYIVSSRSDLDLLNNLMSNEAPILFEGLHTTAFLSHPSLKDRYKMVRMHNVEHHYYKHLEKVERNYFKKYFFRIESERLRKHQRVLKHAQSILTISPKDSEYYRRRHDHVVLVGPFHSNLETTAPRLKGRPKEFVLYHGNLAVGENDQAAMFLANYVFPNIGCKAIIAGNNPSGDLKKLISQSENVELKANLKTEDIHRLIASAQVNVLVTKQATGIKLKLINVLYRGGHCVVNPKMIEGTDLNVLVSIGDSAKELIELIESKRIQSFTEEEKEIRRNLLKKAYCNELNAKTIVGLLSKSNEVELKESLVG